VAQILKCTLGSGLDYDEQGADSARYTATWEAITDEFIPCSLVIELSRSFGVPGKGDAFVFVSHSGYESRDNGVFALDFSCRLKEPGKSRTHYLITVTWRQPTPGGSELPTQVFIDNPIDRPSEWWIEYGVGEEVKRKALPVTNTTTGAVGALEVMKNSVDEPMPPVILQAIRPILVRMRYVSSPIGAMLLNQQFENTTNNADWPIEFSQNNIEFDPSEFEATEFNTTGKLTIKKHYARFLRAEAGRAQYKGNTRYYQEETRIEISREPYYEYRANEGTFYKVGGVKKQLVDDDGYLVPGPYPLKSDGNLAVATDVAEKPYLVLYTANYSQIS